MVVRYYTLCHGKTHHPIYHEIRPKYRIHFSSFFKKTTHHDLQIMQRIPLPPSPSVELKMLRLASRFLNASYSIHIGCCMLLQCHNTWGSLTHKKYQKCDCSRPQRLLRILTTEFDGFIQKTDQHIP